jgi:hypothetical protein
LFFQKGGMDMAAPQFSTFQTRNRPQPRRRFTLAEANRSLTLVQRIVRDIVNTHERATQLQGRLEESTSARDLAGMQSQLDAAIGQLQGYVDELDSVGAELKDYEAGLIDFPGRHQGHDVSLCWKLGEEKIGHWHELQTGYAGRQPISTLVESD